MAAKKFKYDTQKVNPSNFVTFSEIGGLREQLEQLRELIIFPLIYKHIFNNFKIRPPRGVLFYGPPGTGKTLVAGALAKECNKQLNGQISFYSRKGADILDKWVGESENNLRRIFSEAAQNTPAIIFFDEIDGVAPIRSSKQDQVHASIVATLLALMDGLDKLPGVVVIGATNRIDSVDPALRRTGRFDRELYFPLPSHKARLEILEIYTKNWNVRPTPSLLLYLADTTAGFCGSDLQSLCSEAVMCCIRRTYPSINKSALKLNLKTNDLKVQEIDFLTAERIMTPCINKEMTMIRKLSSVVQPLLQNQLERILFLLKAKSPHFTNPNFKVFNSGRYAGRLLITGNVDQGHNNHLAPAILHSLEHMPSFVIDIQTLYKNSSRTAEEICVQKLSEARQNLPAVLLAYRLDEWWYVIEESTRAVIKTLLEDLPAGLPLLIVATSSDLPISLANFFNNHSSIVYAMRNPDEEERMTFLYPIFMKHAYIKCKTVSCSNSESRSSSNEDGSSTFSFYIKDSNRSDSACKFWKKFDLIYKLKLTDSFYTTTNTTTISSDSFNTRVTRSKRYPGLKRVSKSKNLSRKTNKSNYRIKKTNKNHINKKCSSNIRNKKISSMIENELLSHKSNNSKKNIQKASNYSKELKTCYYNNNFNKMSKSTPDSTLNEKNYYVNKDVINDTSGLMFDEMNRKKQQQNATDCDNTESNFDTLAYLFRRAVTVTTLNMSVARLELLYDMLTTCISCQDQDTDFMLQNISCILSNFEEKDMEEHNIM